jgi:hypothetical protein
MATSAAEPAMLYGECWLDEAFSRHSKLDAGSRSTGVPEGNVSLAERVTEYVRSTSNGLAGGGLIPPDLPAYLLSCSQW